jgi:glycerol-1-phosphate dehydrogenase [NAD(P)+]
MDLMYPERMYLHGEQVAVGACFATWLRGDLPGFRSLVRTCQVYGLGLLSEDVGLDDEQFAHVVELAPSTRPGRHTILEELQLERAAIQAAVRTYREQISAAEPPVTLPGGLSFRRS